MIIGLLPAIVVTGFSLVIAVERMIPPLSAYTDFTLWESAPIMIPAPPELFELRFRKLITEAEYYAGMRKHGYDTDIAEKLYLSRFSLLSPDDVMILRRRRHITEADYHQVMAKLGFSRKDSELFYLSRMYYPTPSDLVRWQAREVFEPEMVEKYGLDSEYEEIEKEPFYRAGMDDEQIRNYWRAHWEHPPLTQVYEMLHRNLITKEEVWRYFRIVEIPPFWRDKLIKLSYYPYTRVDVRRMYREGVLDREGVKRAYLDLGYDDEKAENLTLFTIAMAQPKERELTRTQIEKLYKYGEIEKEEAIMYLQEIGYTVEVAELILSLVDMKEADRVLDEKIDLLKTQYIIGMITFDKLQSELDRLAIPYTRREKETWDAMDKKLKKTKMPGKEDIEKFFKAGIIDDKTVKDYMGRIGYRDEDIEIYLKLWKRGT